jgi:CxxC motif-containing protein
VLVQAINIIQNGFITKEDWHVITVLTTVTVVNKQMVNVVIGLYHRMLIKLRLKFGQVVVQEQAEHAVTVVNTQQVDQVETTV